jgi:stage V sporulation protein B
MKNFSKALVWLTFSEIVFNAAGYIIHSAVGRILGPADYGRYGLVVTLTTMIIILIGNGIPTAMSKYLAEIMESDPSRILGIKRKAIRLQMILMTGVTVVFFLASPFLAWLLHDPSLTPLFQLSALIIPAFAAASFYFYYYTGLHFFRLQAMLKMTRALARIVFIISFAYFFGVKGAVSGYIAAPLFVFAVALIADIFVTHRYFPATKSDESKAIDFSGKKILLYAWPLTLFLLFYELITTIDLYLVKSLLGSDYQAGIYNAAITIGRIPYYLFYALTIILLPAISKTTAERDTEETENLVNRSLRLLVLLLFPMVALIILYTPQMLDLFYGAQYATAAVPMMIFTLGVGFLTVFYVLSFALNGAGLVRIPMKLALYGLIGAVALNLILIPKFQLIGAASATTSVSFVLMLGILVYTKRQFNVQVSATTIFRSLIATALIALLSFLLPDRHLLFILSGSTLFFGYFAFLALLGEITPDDVTPLKKIFKR